MNSNFIKCQKRQREMNTKTKDDIQAEAESQEESSFRAGYPKQSQKKVEDKHILYTLCRVYML